MGGNISMEDDVEDLIRMNGGFRYQVNNLLIVNTKKLSAKGKFF